MIADVIKSKVATRLNGIGEYYFSSKLREIEQLNESGAQVINLGIGSPDMAPHPDVISVLQHEVQKPGVHAYQGYKGIPALRNAFAQWYERYFEVDLNPETEILPLIGSKEGIMHICMTYLNTGDEALIPDPGYPAYNSAVQLAGGVPVTYTLLESNDWLPDMQWLDQLDTSRIKLMFLNYPHMPTGKVADETTLAQLVAFAKRKDILLVHDNPYSFILNDNPYSLFKVPGAKAVALELNSLSKSHNMAGWRLGVLIGAAERIIEVLRFKSNMDSGMFLPLQLAAVKALGLGEQWYTKLNDIYRLRREKVHAILDTLGCPYLPGQSGLFVWAHIPEHYENAYVFSDEVLQRYHIFITPGAIFGNEGLHYVRVSLCADISILEETLKRLPGFKT